MFATIREKIRSIGQQQDETDKKIGEIVDRATSELLIGPDWSINLELVDYINRSVYYDKALRQMRRTMSKPSPKTQLLTLTLLETCAKNCPPKFHMTLAESDFWKDLIRHVNDPKIGRVDAEVCDKILCLVEDLAKGMKIPAFQEAYEGLLDAGVDFPVRTEEEVSGGITGTAYEPPQIVMPGEAAGRAGDVSEEDKAAIAAALADLEAAEAAKQIVISSEAEARAAGAASAAVTSSPIPHASPAANAVSPVRSPPMRSLPASPVPAPLVSEPVQRHPEQAPGLPHDIGQALEVIANSRKLLCEMLASLPPSEPGAVQQGFIVELAGGVRAHKEWLRSVMGGEVEEGLLVAALAEHEEVATVMACYEELLKRAREGTATADEPDLLSRRAPTVSPTQPLPGPDLIDFNANEDDLVSNRAAEPTLGLEGLAEVLQYDRRDSRADSLDMAIPEVTHKLMDPTPNFETVQDAQPMASRAYFPPLETEGPQPNFLSVVEAPPVADKAYLPPAETESSEPNFYSVVEATPAASKVDAPEEAASGEEAVALEDVSLGEVSLTTEGLAVNPTHPTPGDLD